MTSTLRRPPVRPSASAILALPLCALAVSGGPGYAPEPDAADTQYWEVTHTLSLDDITVELSNDDDVEVPEIEMEATRTRTVTMEQVHETAAMGAPTSLRRTFVDLDDGIEGSFLIEEEDISETLEAEVEGDLADRSIRLRYSEEEEDWARSFVDEDGEEADGPVEALEGLAADAHLGGLLAGLEDSSEGASWTADPAALVALVSPGGKTYSGVAVSSAAERGMEPALAGLDPLLGMELWELLGGPAAELEGEIECQVKSVTDQAMVVSFNVDVTSTCDVAEKHASWVENLDMPIGVEVTSAEATLHSQGEGSVTWDLKTNLPVKVELELELGYKLMREAALAIPGEEEAVLSTEINLVGKLQSTMSVE